MKQRVDFLHIVMFKWGTRYPSEEVNIMRAMVDRHLSVPHKVHCVTDDPAGLDEGIVVHPLVDLGVPGNLRKLQSFSEDFLGLKGEYVVCCDIDMVIVGSLDFLADDPEKDFVIVQNWKRGKFSNANSTLYRIKVGTRTHLWEGILDDLASDDPKAYSRKKSSDQAWIGRNATSPDYFPEGKVVSYKFHCNARAWKLFGTKGAKLGLTTAHFGKARAPEGASVVSFHGEPSPRDVKNGRWGHWRQAQFVLDHWHK